MSCSSSCKKHPHDPGAVIKQAVNRVGGAKGLFVACSFGPPGAGKSEWNVLLGIEIQKALGHALQPKDLKHQLRFKPKDFPTMAASAGRRRAVFCDEGSGEGANKMQPMSKENVSVGIDLDACRGREQPVFWANPYRSDLTRQVQKHMTWAFEFNLNHSLTAWECEAPDPIFGKEPYLHERFVVDDVPWLQDYYPEHRAEYLTLKDAHSRGQDAAAGAKRERQLAEFEAAVLKVLGPKR